MRLLPFLIPIFAKDGLIDRRIARALGDTTGMVKFLADAATERPDMFAPIFTATGRRPA